MSQYTEIICKSDCEFANNDERKCSLDLMELSQTNPKSPILHCQQYIQGNKPNPKYASLDIERAKMAGAYEAIAERLEK